MIYKSVWSEICYELSEGIKRNVSEGEFEKYVETALRELGWKKSTGDFETRFNISVGANKRLTPDFVIRDILNTPLFVIEIKKPGVAMKTSQLQSYMRQLKLEYGLFIGSDIKIYYDGYLSNNNNLELIKRIPIDANNEEGIEFVKVFNKQSFNFDNLKLYVKEVLDERELEKQKEEIFNEIKTELFSDKLKELALSELSKKYESELVNNVLKEVSFHVLGSLVNKNVILPSKDKTINKTVNVKKRIDSIEVDINSIKVFEIDIPQDLMFTKVVEGKINGIKVNNWGKALRLAVKVLIEKGVDCDEIVSISKLNIKHGSINHGGFNAIDDTGYSIQRVESNRAGQSLSALSKAYGLDINITYIKTR